MTPPLNYSVSSVVGSSHTWAWGEGYSYLLLKGKVRIPPPAGHFFDPPSSQEFFSGPPFVSRTFFNGAYKNQQKCVSKMQNDIL